MAFSTHAGQSSNPAYITSVFIGYIRYWLDWFAYQTLRAAKADERWPSIINVGRSSICWRRPEDDNGRQETRNHGYDVIVGRRAIYWLLRSPSPVSTLNPKLKSTGAGHYQPFPVGGMPTASSLAERRLSLKSQDAVALQQIKGRGALPMIDRGDIRQAIDRYGNIWASTARRWL